MRPAVYKVWSQAFVALALLSLLPLLAQLAGYAFADDGQGAVVTWVHPESLWHPVIEPESRLVAVDGQRIRFAHEVSPWQAYRALAKGYSFADRASLVGAEQDLSPSFTQEVVATDCVLTRPSAQWHYLVFERPRWTRSRDTQQTEQPKAVARLDTDPALTATRQVLWFDEPLECVLRDIRLSDYQRRAKEPFIERCVLHGVEKLLAYLFLVSLGLGLVNIVPAVGLDGAHMFQLFAEILIQKLGHRHQAGARVLRLAMRALLALHTLLLAGLWLMAVFTQQLEPHVAT
ncbi:hypothetical protein F1559_002560 [Cyanidiococcus yangmingshanensis]|uniref:Endopeptidase S2P n=1 Tax=Cyanidiococcus yangmingshanensis TaxID=2690220 RepID=A0A7J7IC52_9RHOD|nr:hypothetical protein F1559_002560 [Cyanidiococcus yangmingshanensis]